MMKVNFKILLFSVVFAVATVLSSVFLVKPANAKTLFELLRPLGGSIETNIRTWSLDVAYSLPVNGALTLLCGDGYNDEKVLEGKPCIPKNMSRYRLHGRLPGGLAAVATRSAGLIVTEPPVPINMALFINDITDNTMFGGRVYAASNPGPFLSGFHSTVFGIWKISRNLAISLLGVILAFGGFMIMFRHKIGPQTVVSIYNVLPYVPVGIILIILSYPIITLALQAIMPLMAVAASVGSKTATTMVTSPDLPADPELLGFFGTIVNLFIPGVTAAVGGLQSLISLISVIVGLFIIVSGVLRYIYEYITIYVRFVWYAIAFPFVGLLFLIPGNQKILSNFARKILVDVLYFPVLTLAFFIAMGIMGSDLNAIANPDPVLDFGIFLTLVKVGIGLGIIWKTTKLRKTLEGVLKTEKGIFVQPAQPQRR